MERFLPELDQTFCANTTCDLHVSPRDAHVRGRGNWAERANGIIVGRSMYGGKLLCDPCGQSLIGTRKHHERVAVG